MPVAGALDFPAGGAHAGQRNGRSTAGANGLARFAYATDVVDDGGTNVYCAAAWAKGTAPYMRLQLLTDSVVNQFSAPLTAQWQRVPPSINLDADNAGSKRLLLVFETQIGRSDGNNSKPGDTLEIDDVDVWQSADGGCRER